MKLNKEEALVFVPSNEDETKCLKQTTHMCIAAHQDDVEIMAYDGVVKCFQQPNKHFSAIVVTNGAGSARDNVYKDFTNEEMIQVRKKEQIKAAQLGEYSTLSMLMYPSSDVKNPNNEEAVEDIYKLLMEATPEIVYTHNLADKHDTHIGVVVKTITAIRKMDKKIRPKKLYGCEVWRALDWVNDDEKVFLDVSEHPNLAAGLVEVFDSQIIGGKRYDKATIGRRLANATFSSSHAVDTSDQVTYAMDLTPLIQDDSLDIALYVLSYIERFKMDVRDKIKRMSK